MVSIEAAGQRFFECGALGARLAEHKFGKCVWVTLSCDECLKHRPSRLAEDVGGDSRELDQAVLEQLFDALLMTGTLLGELGPKPGVVAELSDLSRRDEGGSQHAALVQFGQPHSVELVSLGASRHVLHVPGVDQPDPDLR